MNKKQVIFGIVAAVVISASILFYNNFTIFVVQPIGAVPEGRTIILEKRKNMQFIDSADAMCERLTGSVNLLCRGMALGEVAKMKIYGRLPYSEWLYLKSTDGKQYSK